MAAAKQAHRWNKREGSNARSRALHEAGFTSLRQAALCSAAVIDDLEAGHIDAAEANYINAAVGQWRRAHIRRGGS
jgi:hypothetical protein